MRLTFVISAGIAMAGLAAACSKPGSSPTVKGSREIVLPTTARPDAAVVSDLEAGRPTKPKPPGQQAPATTLVKTRSEPSIAPVQLPATANASIEARSLELAPLPASTAVAPAPAPSPDPAPAEASEGWQAGTYHGHRVDTSGGSGSGGGSHGPAIILRGGLGGDGDKCDLRPRMWRGGIAINRSVPSFGGYPQGIR